MSPTLFFIILSVFWIVWSGMLDAFHLTLGVVSCAIVLGLTKTSLKKRSETSFLKIVRQFIAFERYSFWLLKEIIVANIQVFNLAISPNLLKKINPKMSSFKTKINSEAGQFVLAQSITLTPGTVTTRIDNGTFLIHAISDDAADALPGDMQDKVHSIYCGDDK